MVEDAPDVVVVLDVAGGPEQVELAAADLWAAGATAVEESGTDLVTLTASFPSPTAARSVAAEIGGRAVELTDTSWRDRWKDFAEPVDVGGSLVVAPAWREVPVGGGRLVVRIDPGPCFGSGTHPSTRLLLGLLAARSPLAGSVLDVGCGSGILSVTAALLGATVTAVDIDPDAVTCTRQNALANGVADRVRVSTDPVETAGRSVGGAGGAEGAEGAGGVGGFDLALVNVTAGVHVTLGSAVTTAVRPGGTILLAGLLPGQWRHVAEAYAGAVLVERPVLDGWEGATLRRGEATYPGL